MGLPGPGEETLPGHPKCGEFSEAIKVILWCCLWPLLSLMKEAAIN